MYKYKLNTRLGRVLVIMKSNPDTWYRIGDLMTQYRLPYSIATGMYEIRNLIESRVSPRKKMTAGNPLKEYRLRAGTTVEIQGNYIIAYHPDIELSLPSQLPKKTPEQKTLKNLVKDFFGNRIHGFITRKIK